MLTGSPVLAGDWVADDVHLAFGGVAPKTITAPKTEALLRGQPWTEDNVTAALKTLAEDVWISPDAPGATICGRVQGQCGAVASRWLTCRPAGKTNHARSCDIECAYAPEVKPLH